MGILKRKEQYEKDTDYYNESYEKYVKYLTELSPLFKNQEQYFITYKTAINNKEKDIKSLLDNIFKEELEKGLNYNTLEVSARKIKNNNTLAIFFPTIVYEEKEYKLTNANKNRIANLIRILKKDYILEYLKELNIVYKIKYEHVIFTFRQHSVKISPEEIYFNRNKNLLSYYKTGENVLKEFPKVFSEIKKNYPKFEVEIALIENIILVAYNNRIVREEKYLRKKEE